MRSRRCRVQSDQRVRKGQEQELRLRRAPSNSNSCSHRVTVTLSRPLLARLPPPRRMDSTVENPVAAAAGSGGSATTAGSGAGALGETESYAATVTARCKPCGICPPCAKAGRHDDDGDLRFISARAVAKGDLDFPQAKTYQDLGVPQLLLLGLQHYLAVVASVTGLAGVMARGGQCKGSNKPGEGACYIDDLETMQDLVMWTVIISGICTVLQCIYTGQFSSNVLSIMGTSSAFISVVGITGKMAAAGDGVALVMRMNALTFWIEPFFIYFLPQNFIDNKLLDPTVKESVVITIGLTLTARVGTKSWIGDGHASDAVLGLVCVMLLTALTRLNEMKNADGTKRQPKWLLGIPLGRFALVLALAGGWVLKSMAGDMLMMNKLPDLGECPDLCSAQLRRDQCEDACASLSSCVTPTRPDGYDYTNLVDDTVSRSREAFNVTGLSCAENFGRPIDRQESTLLESVLGNPVCPRCEGETGACACPCTYGGDSFRLIGCEANEAEQHFMFPAFSIPDNVDTSSYANGVYPTFALLIPWFITRIASSLESIGDITATVAESGKVTEGEKFRQRLRGGLSMDALSGFMGACVGGLPLTTLSQNNGLIKQAGWHDYRGGIVAGTLLLLTGIAIGQVPAEVALASAGNSRLAACLTVIFATIAVGGFERLFKFSPQDLRKLRNLDSELARRRFITAAAVGVGLGSEMHAYGLNHRATFLAKDFAEVKALSDFHKTHLMEPQFNVAEHFFVQQTLSIIFASGVATTTLAALLLNFIWPKEMLGENETRADAAPAPAPAAATAPAAAPVAAPLATVLECVAVNTWLVENGFSAQAETILQSFAEAGIPVMEWLPELRSMSSAELSSFISATNAQMMRSAGGNGSGSGNGSVSGSGGSGAPAVALDRHSPATDGPANGVAAHDGGGVGGGGAHEYNDEEAVVPGADFVAARRAAKEAKEAALAVGAGAPAPTPTPEPAAAAFAEEMDAHTDDI